MKQGTMSWWQPIDLHVHEPLELINDGEAFELRFELVNYLSKPIIGDLYINECDTPVKVSLQPKAGQSFRYGEETAVFGTNRIRFKTKDTTYLFDALNWTLPNPIGSRYKTVDLTGIFNEKVTDMFAYGKYLTPRWPYTTLQVPTQGMGQWCHPEDLSNIDDSGLRALAGATGQFMLPQGIPFRTPRDSSSKNIILTTLWDNYPNAVSIPVSGKASKVYLLIAASTYHMQAHFLNGTVTATYQDGTKDVLELVLPDNLLPLDQDIFIDGFAFKCKNPRPYRIRLKTGDVSRNHAKTLGLKMSNGPILIDGGMATIIDMALDKNKTLTSLTLETTANEVIIGLMAATLVR
jgi:hypothetical protein